MNDLLKIESLLKAGTSGAEKVGEILKTVLAVLENMANLQKLLEEPEVKKAIQSTPSYSPASTIEELAQWKPKGEWLGDDEVAKRVAAMSRSMSKEKWIDGFSTCLTLISRLQKGA